MSQQRHVIISGAGIAGLSAALALAQKGCTVTIIEKASALEEVGAGLQLAPNATRILRNWGVLDSLADYAVEPDVLNLKRGSDGKTLVQMDIKAASISRWRAPYLVVHRADLQSVLSKMIEAHPAIELRLGCEVLSYEGALASGFNTHIMHDGKEEQLRSDMLIGCDGVWSNMRKQPPLAEISDYSGFIAWRAAMPIENVPQSFLIANGEKSIGAWLGGNGHFISYPLKSGKAFNFVAIIDGPNPGKTWSKEGDSHWLMKEFQHWCQPILDVMARTENWTYWPLYRMPFPRFLGPSQEVFLGDASHAVTPFAAQGAAMAIEDAAALAAIIDREDLSLAEALEQFDVERSKRLKAVAKRGDFNRFVYHASGPVAFARNVVMKMRSSEKFLTDLDWLYGYDAIAFAQKRSS